MGLRIHSGKNEMFACESWWALLDAGSNVIVLSAIGEPLIMGMGASRLYNILPLIIPLHGDRQEVGNIKPFKFQ